MEDMTYDMAGSATVVGLMKNLALRKAKINAVGVVGLVENMPGGNAQRPGDIVKSYSGKTIEVLNTDAEGRLVLADALTYTEKKFNPKIIVDLATLTGAIIVCLGSEYAGLFSNDDKLSKQIFNAGEKVEESHDCGCGCGGVTEGGCSTNISEGKHDKTLDKLADLVKGAKSFMDIGKELKKAKIKDYHFSTSMLPMYVINIGGAKVAILNKKYADGAERIVGTTAIGLMESVNEGMFGLIDQIKQDSKDAKDFVKNIFSDKSFKDMKNDKDFIKYLKSIYEGFKISEELTFEINTFLERPILSKNKITLENSNIKDVINVLVKEGIHKRLSSGVKREFTELLKKHK